MKNTKAVIELLQSDKRYVRLLESFHKSSAFKIPSEEIKDEIKRIMEIRPIRRLDTGSPKFVDKLIDANVKDQAHRSRLSEIRLTCLRVSISLDNALKELREHFLIKYSEQLRSFRTKGERLTVLNMALKEVVRFIDDLAVIVKMAEIVTNDIDQGAFSLRRSVDSMKLHVAKEHNL